ncbi:DUF1244 domain-containing protein [Alphaproteobacteria bacterium]|nr:DUF1244 domain-containing protein [Alphaproteobacteria bacterium]
MKKNNENDEINKMLLIESQVLQKLLIHLQKRTDVQNIDLMNLSGFCRNCLSRWYSEAASENGVNLNKDKAKEIVYGMPLSVWKDRYQKDASEKQKNNFIREELKEK